MVGNLGADVYEDGTGSTSLITTYSAGDIIGIALDMDNKGN